MLRSVIIWGSRLIVLVAVIGFFVGAFHAKWLAVFGSVMLFALFWRSANAPAQ